MTIINKIYFYKNYNDFYYCYNCENFIGVISYSNFRESSLIWMSTELYYDGDIYLSKPFETGNGFRFFKRIPKFDKKKMYIRKFN